MTSPAHPAPGLRLGVLGSTISVTGLPHETTLLLRDLLSAFRRAGAVSEAQLTVKVHQVAGGWEVAGGEEYAGAATAEDLPPAVLAVVNRLALRRTDLFAVHAGVVANGNTVIAFPSASGGGKSTLTAAALLRGLRYVSDEALCVDRRTGVVVPYPKPLALSRWSTERLGLTGPESSWAEALFRPSDLGAHDAGPNIGLTLRHVVTLSRRPGPPALHPRPASTSVAALLERSFNHFHDPPGSFDITGRLARSAQAWLLEYDDPLEAAGLLGGLDAHRAEASS